MARKKIKELTDEDIDYLCWNGSFYGCERYPLYSGNNHKPCKAEYVKKFQNDEVEVDEN